MSNISALKQRFKKACGVGVLLFVPALAAFMIGQPLIFPSLGPSAYNLALGSERRHTVRVVIGGHFIGVICGLISYKILAAGLVLGHIHNVFSLDMLRLASGGVVSVILTTWFMLAFDCAHSPACATTLIVSLGFLSTLFDAVLIMVSVSAMVLVHKIFFRLYL